MSSEKTKYSFKLDSCFPPNFYALGIFGIIAGLTMIFYFDSNLYGVILLLISLPFCFTSKGVRINLKNKTIKTFTSVVGIEFGNSSPYRQLKELRLKSERISQTMNSRGSSTTLRYTEYTIVLITDSDRYDLDSAKKRD